VRDEQTIKKAIREKLVEKSPVREFELRDGAKVGYRVIGPEKGEELNGEIAREIFNNDQEEYAGKPDGDTAVYEFKILLDSGDEFDGVLNPGEEHKVIFSVNDRVIDFDSKHTKKSSGRIQLAQ